jgi:hypothetical protein
VNRPETWWGQPYAVVFTTIPTTMQVQHCLPSHIASATGPSGSSYRTHSTDASTPCDRCRASITFQTCLLLPPHDDQSTQSPSPAAVPSYLSAQLQCPARSSHACQAPQGLAAAVAAAVGDAAWPVLLPSSLCGAAVTACLRPRPQEGAPEHACKHKCSHSSTG